MNELLGGMRLAETESILIYETAHPGDNPHGGTVDVVDPPRHAAGNVYASRQVPSAFHWLPQEGGPATPSFEVERE
jgi:hypothetical protein